MSTAPRRWLSVVLFVLLLTGCETMPPIRDKGPHTHLVHVTSNGWHTAIIVPAPALVATGAIPELEDFSGTAFLEFGWGDRTYYPADTKTLGMTLSAALVLTPAVMHVAGHQAAPKGGTGYELISVGLTEEGFRRLARTIAAEFERPAGGRAEAISRGLYPHSYFYRAHGDFHLFNTCNTRTARMLNASGVALSPSGIVTADKLMTRLRAALAAELTEMVYRTSRCECARKINGWPSSPRLVAAQDGMPAAGRGRVGSNIKSLIEALVQQNRSVSSTKQCQVATDPRISAR